MFICVVFVMFKVPLVRDGDLKTKNAACWSAEAWREEPDSKEACDVGVGWLSAPYAALICPAIAVDRGR
jgi:hypothetical protein